MGIDFRESALLIATKNTQSAKKGLYLVSDRYLSKFTKAESFQKKENFFQRQQSSSPHLFLDKNFLNLKI